MATRRLRARAMGGIGLWLLAQLALSAAPAWAAAKVGDPAPPLSVADVMNRPVSVPTAGKVMVLSFASRSTGEAAGEVTRALRVRHPEVEFAAFVDLSSYPGFLHGIIRNRVAAHQDGAVADAQAAFVKAGKTPPEDLAARLHIVPTFDTLAATAYGAGDTGDRFQLVMVGAEGTIRAILPQSPSLEEAEAALLKSLPPQAPAMAR